MAKEGVRGKGWRTWQGKHALGGGGRLRAGESGHQNRLLENNIFAAVPSFVKLNFLHISVFKS